MKYSLSLALSFLTSASIAQACSAEFDKCMAEIKTYGESNCDPIRATNPRMAATCDCYQKYDFYACYTRCGSSMSEAMKQNFANAESEMKTVCNDAGFQPYQAYQQVPAAPAAPVDNKVGGDKPKDDSPKPEDAPKPEGAPKKDDSPNVVGDNGPQLPQPSPTNSTGLPVFNVTSPTPTPSRHNSAQNNSYGMQFFFSGLFSLLSLFAL